jgi:pimeloyl-ACP methyl ester carboxylesterase
MSIAALIALTSLTALAQNAPESREAAKAWAAEYVRFFKVESKLTPQDVDRLIEIRMKLYAPTSSLEDRQAAMKEFGMLLFRVAGTTPAPPEAFYARFGENQGRLFHQLMTDPNAKRVDKTTPLGQLGQVEKRGRGPIPMILIADVRTDWTIYQSFIDRNADRYTMYAVTLAGYGGTPAPPKSGVVDLAATPWWDGAEKGVLDLIEKNKLDRPAVIGLGVSSYLAARLAIDHPNRIRSAVMLDGVAYVPFRSLANPDLPASLAERPAVLQRQPGAIGMIQEMMPPRTFSREAAEARVKALPAPQLTANVHDIERGRAIAISSAINTDPRSYRYISETYGADLTPALKDLKTPLLAIAAVHDDNSPGQGGNNPSVWYEMKLKYPSIPLTAISFEDTRSYLHEEAPAELDRAIEAFLAGKPVVGKTGMSMASRPSPRGEVAQQVGAVKVELTYGRPQVNKRQVWGQLVPWNRLWRAGANESTYISFNSDVQIEGRKLAAGSYGLFAIPTENEWTIIFNRVPGQWGAFYYNPEFDALQVKVKPQTAEHEEWLSYGFEMVSPNAANVVLRWEKLKVAFKVEPDAAKAPNAGN